MTLNGRNRGHIDSRDHSCVVSLPDRQDSLATTAEGTVSLQDDHANVASSWQDGQRHSSISLVFATPPLDAFLRAVAFCGAEGWNLDLLDVEHVEAMWELLDGRSASHGFVLALTGGRRAYLQCISDNDHDDVQFMPMSDEHYPSLKGRGFAWTDRVGDLNRFLEG